MSPGFSFSRQGQVVIVDGVLAYEGFPGGGEAQVLAVVHVPVVRFVS